MICKKWLIFIVVIFIPAINYAAQIQVSYQQGEHVQMIVGERTKLGYEFNMDSKQTVTMATLEWPPYISEKSCHHGWVFQYAVALLVSKGYHVVISFYPWARAVKLVESGKIDVLFPDYFIEADTPSDVFIGKKRRDLLALSGVFSGGEIAFIKRKGEDDHFDGKLINLKHELIGVVRGYQNTPAFDKMMDNHQFNIVEAVNDLQQVKLLIAKRVNLIIGDPLVIKFSIEDSPLTQSVKQRMLASIENVKPNLQYNYLYFDISKQRPHWQQLLTDINYAITEFSQQGITKQFINNNFNCIKAKFNEIGKLHEY